MGEEKKNFLSQKWVIFAIVGTFLLGSVAMLACCGGISFMSARHAAALKKAELEAEQKVQSLEKNDYDHFWKDGHVSPKKLEDFTLPETKEKSQITIPPEDEVAPVEIRKPDDIIRELKKSKRDVPSTPQPEKNSPKYGLESGPKQN